MGFEGRQQLANLGRCRVGVQNQAPDRALDRAGLDGGSERRRDEGRNGLEAGDRFVTERSQARQAG